MSFTVTNAATQTPVPASLAGLRLSSVTVSGAGSQQFSLAGFQPITLSPGHTSTFSVLPSASATLPFAVTLTISTDQFAAPGAAGQTYSFTLSSESDSGSANDSDVPLPPWALLLLDAGLFGALRRQLCGGN